jgi:hypothetical protein
MKVNPHLEDDELALFAMHLLSESEAAAVARDLEKNQDARWRLAEIVATLAAYAEASIELRDVPSGSLDRLLARTTQKRDLASDLVPRTTATPRVRSGFVAMILPLSGWALATAMIVIAGKLYQDRSTLHRALNNQTGQVAHISAKAVDVDRERDALKAALSRQSDELAALRTELGNQKRETATLQGTIAGETTELNQQKAKVAAQAAVAETAGRDEERLQQTIAAQNTQLATLRAEERRAEQVLNALTDRTALRVTLTKPKAKAAPQGRAIYVASRGTLVFLASNLAPLGANRVYQLWLMPADQAKPVPAGTFVPDPSGNASVVNTEFLGPLAAKGFGVTIEKVGGSQVPTLPIILASE